MYRACQAACMRDNWYTDLRRAGKVYTVLHSPDLNARAREGAVWGEARAHAPRNLSGRADRSSRTSTRDPCITNILSIRCVVDGANAASRGPAQGLPRTHKEPALAGRAPSAIHAHPRSSATEWGAKRWTTSWKGRGCCIRPRARRRTRCGRARPSVSR
jgi:hypothetical protein